MRPDFPDESLGSGNAAGGGGSSNGAADTSVSAAPGDLVRNNSNHIGARSSAANDLAANVARNVLEMGRDEGNSVELYYIPCQGSLACWAIQKTPLVVRVMMLPVDDCHDLLKGGPADRGDTHPARSAARKVLFQVPSTEAAAKEVAKRTSDVINPQETATLVLCAYGLKSVTLLDPRYPVPVHGLQTYRPPAARRKRPIATMRADRARPNNQAYALRRDTFYEIRVFTVMLGLQRKSNFCFTEMIVPLLIASAAAVAATAVSTAQLQPGRGDIAIPHHLVDPVKGFVLRQNSTLWSNGGEYRWGGCNMYWLGLDENVGGVHYPTKFRIVDALTTAAGMGMTAVRSHSVGISTGNPLSFEPSLNVFNDSALDAADYAVYVAVQLGIRLIVPLTDNYHYYHG